MSDIPPPPYPVWTFAWGGGVSEQLDWLTDVLSSATGYEQRRRLRNAPRVTLSWDGLESCIYRRYMESLITTNGGRLWFVPLLCDGMQLLSPPANNGTLVGDSSYRRFVENDFSLLIQNNPLRYETPIVSAVTDTGLQISGTSIQWPAGSWIYPLHLARLSVVPTLSRFSADDVSYQVSFKLEDPLDVIPDFGTSTYRGYPVFEWHTDWSIDPEYTALRSLQLVDAETGSVSTFDLVGSAVSTYVVSLTAVGRASIRALYALLYALAGRWASIWVPSFAHDIHIVSAVAGGAISLDVEYSGLSTWWDYNNRRDLRIALRDGEVIYRRIVNVASFGNIERLLLDEAVSHGFDIDEVDRVSYMALCRQEADINRLDWWSYDAVRTQISWRTFPHAV